MKITNDTFSLEKAIEFRKRARKQKKTFVLTNGCFDLIHAGHIQSLEECSQLGDYLWVALNSDKSVRQLKGKGRPIQDEIDRAYILNSIKFVSGVIIFNDTKLIHEINCLRPDIYAKSADYNLETIDTGEKQALKNAGSQIKFVPFVSGKSTSSLIKTFNS